MTQTVFALPVSVEQVAAVIKQMPPTDRQRLLELVPELREAPPLSTPRTLAEASASAELTRAEVKQALAGQPVVATDPFVGNLTLEQYLNLPDEERARLWELPAGATLMEAEEREVKPDAVLAR